MSSLLHFADYAVICVMMAISACVGIYFRISGGKQKTALEFLMANKNMTILPVAFSILASTMSAVAILGVPAEAYLFGTQMMIRDITHQIGTVIAAYCIVPLYFELEVETIFEYLEKRFGKVTKLCLSLLYVLQMILYMPIVIYAPSLAISLVTGLPLWTCIITVALVCTFYSTLGGLKAVLWTDLLQGALMVLTIYVLIIKGSLDFGGFYDWYKTAEDGKRLELFNTSVDPTVRYTLWNSILHGMIQGVYLNGSNFTIIQRLMSCGSLKKAQRSLLWSIPLTFIFQIGTGLLGVTMYSYFHDCDPISDKEVTSKDQLVPFFALKIFGQFPGLPGFCIAGILSAALSTLSSILNSLAAVTIEDYIKPFNKCFTLKESSAAALAKFLALFYGALCLCLTFVVANAKGLHEAASLLLGMVGAPNLGIFLLGMFTTTANECGALIGLIAGVALSAWFSFGSLYSNIKYPPFPLSTEGCDSIVNITSYNTMYESGSTFDREMLNCTRTFNVSPEERYIFPLYKVSFFWITSIGFLSTVIVGYSVSIIIGFFTTKKEVKPQHLSPVVRKWLCKSSDSLVRKEYIKAPSVLCQGMKAVSDENQSEKF